MPFDQVSRPARRIRRAPILSIAVAALALSGAATHPVLSRAAPPPAPPSASATYGQPDVQVLIVPAPGGDMIDLAYPGVVPPVQAERDVTAVLHAGGWHTSDVDISNDALPVQGRAAIPMTGVTFQIVGATPAPGETTIRLEPWAVGLRAYRTIAVTYILGPDFKFNGLRAYQDSHVQIALDQEQSTLTYHVRILDGGRFSSLGLPLTQPAPQTSPYSPPKLNWMGILVVGLAAAGVGYAVYTLLSRLH